MKSRTGYTGGTSKMKILPHHY